MREIAKEYYERLNSLVPVYGTRVLLLYQQGVFYYLLSADNAEINRLQIITGVSFTRGRACDAHMKCRFPEDRVDEFTSMLTSHYFTVICYNLKKDLCCHKKRLCDCKRCSVVEGTHELGYISIPEEEQEYVIVEH